jgi:hypothetical protein
MRITIHPAPMLEEPEVVEPVLASENRGRGLSASLLPNAGSGVHGESCWITSSSSAAGISSRCSASTSTCRRAKVDPPGADGLSPPHSSGDDLKVMHWWFQDGLVGWVGFFLALLIGLGIGLILRTGLRARLH